MLRKIVAVSALVVGLVPAVSMSAMAQSAPKVTVFNQGGYVADYQVNYVHSGRQQSIKVAGLVVGKKQTVTLPLGSSQISVRGQVRTGLFWEPLREIFNKPAQNGSCFKTFGTIFKTGWNTSCTADF